jgi:hypothetical protein
MSSLRQQGKWDPRSRRDSDSEQDRRQRSRVSQSNSVKSQSNGGNISGHRHTMTNNPNNRTGSRSKYSTIEDLTASQREGQESASINSCQLDGIKSSIFTEVGGSIDGSLFTINILKLDEKRKNIEHDLLRSLRGSKVSRPKPSVGG